MNNARVTESVAAAYSEDMSNAIETAILARRIYDAWHECAEIETDTPCGVRVLRGEHDALSSQRWDDGVATGEFLGGCSAIQLNNMGTVLTLAQAQGAAERLAQYGSGCVVLLIGIDMRGGEDAGEVVIRRPRVVASITR